MVDDSKSDDEVVDSDIEITEPTPIDCWENASYDKVNHTCIDNPIITCEWGVSVWEYKTFSNQPTNFIFTQKQCLADWTYWEEVFERCYDWYTKISWELKCKSTQLFCPASGFTKDGYSYTHWDIPEGSSVEWTYTYEIDNWEVIKTEKIGCVIQDWVKMYNSLWEVWVEFFCDNWFTQEWNSCVSQTCSIWDLEWWTRNGAWVCYKSINFRDNNIWWLNNITQYNIPSTAIIKVNHNNTSLSHEMLNLGWIIKFKTYSYYTTNDSIRISHATWEVYKIKSHLSTIYVYEK